MTIIGHEALRDALATNVPQVVLVEGPEGIGKSMVLREAAAKLTKSWAITDVGRTICTQSVEAPHNSHSRNCDVLTMKVAHHIIDSLATRQRVDRVLIFDASRANRMAMNAMLKTLEEPPPGLHVLMSATPGSTLPTIRSRATIFKAQPLADDQVEELLVEWGVQRDKAERASRVSNGRPGLAKQWAAALQQRGTAIQIIRAGAEKDKILLANVCHGLQPTNEDERREMSDSGDTRRGRQTLLLLQEAFRQARTRLPGIFDEDEIEPLLDVPPARMDKIMKALQSPPRAELAVRSVVLQIWKQK